MSLELERIRPSRDPSDDESNSEERHISALAPADEGAQAWRFLFGSFLIEAVLWGFPMTFGVFQEYYARLPAFGDDPNIAVIGTISTSIQFLGAPFATPLVKKFHSWQRVMIMTGTAMCVLALVAASFAETVAALIATQGVLYGTGFLLLYFPLLSMLNEWFVRRRGLAYGILYAGGGFSGVGLPFLMQWLLGRYGHQTTLRIVAVGQAILLGPTMLLLKGRLPPASRTAMRSIDFEFLKMPQFWILAISNLLQGFAYYIPSLYLPTFASLVGLSPQVGALLLAAHNLSSTLGQVGLGHISDRVNNVYILIFGTTFIAGTASFCIWGLAHSLAPLLVYAILFGAFGGAYVVLWPKFGSMLSEDPQPVYSLMAFGKGLGNVATGPIAGAMLTKPVSSGYGLGRYEPLIIYMGSLLLGSSLGIIGWPLQAQTS